MFTPPTYNWIPAALLLLVGGLFTACNQDAMVSEPQLSQAEAEDVASAEAVEPNSQSARTLQANGDQGNDGKGTVGGHTEGPPPIDGEVCVDRDGDNNTDQCEPFDHNTGHFEIEIAKQHVNTATFTVWVGDGDGTNFKIGERENADEDCEDLPLDGAGMALCQHPEHDETHRFNAYWNENSSNGGREGGGEGREGTR